MHKKRIPLGRIVFIVTWILLFAYLIFDGLFVHLLPNFMNGPDDVARRVTAPDGSKTALLLRDFFFIDLNFHLFIVKAPYADPPDLRKALWVSQDYLPDTINWHEDIEWSADSSVIAVIVEDQYVFAYDFELDQRLEDPEAIRRLLAVRSHP
jgi:hypothetical protein